MFINNLVGNLYANDIHMQTFEACCSRKPEFRYDCVDLTENFYDDLVQTDSLHLLKWGICGDVVRSELE